LTHPKPLQLGEGQRQDVASRLAEAATRLEAQIKESQEGEEVILTQDE
jgi:hypothetical protein